MTKCSEGELLLLGDMNWITDPKRDSSSGITAQIPKNFKVWLEEIEIFFRYQHRKNTPIAHIDTICIPE